MLPPPRNPRHVEPEQLIEEIENDAVSQFVWDLIPKVARAIRTLAEAIRAEHPEVPEQQCMSC